MTTKLLPFTYRADISNESKFNNAVWFFGCSCVYGESLEEHESAPYQLGQLIKIPVFNFGICGGNIANINKNLDYLLSKYVPHSVVIAWPDLHRWMDDNDQNWGTWAIGKPAHKDSPGLAKYIELLKIGKTEEISRNLIPVIYDKLKNVNLIEYHYNPLKGKELTDYLNDRPHLQTVYRPPFVDYAPDNMHPGPQTQINVATWVAEQLTHKDPKKFSIAEI